MADCPWAGPSSRRSGGPVTEAGEEAVELRLAAERLVNRRDPDGGVKADSSAGEHAPESTDPLLDPELEPELEPELDPELDPELEPEPASVGLLLELLEQAKTSAPTVIIAPIPAYFLNMSASHAAPQPQAIENLVTVMPPGRSASAKTALSLCNRRR